MPQTQTQLHTHPLTRTDLIRALDQEVDRLLQARHLLAETLPASASQPVTTAQVITTSGGGTYWDHHPDHFPAQSGSFVAVPTKIPTAINRAAEEIRKIRNTKPARRKLSAAARRRISEAQTARWKKFHQAQRAEKKSQVA